MQQLATGLFANDPFTHKLDMAVQQLFRHPLHERAKETIGRQLRSQIKDEQLAELVVMLYEEERLCHVQEEEALQEPQIICSLGLTF